MGYSALQAMQEKNKKKYGTDGLPAIPEVPPTKKSGSLAYYALGFLRDACEELRFDTAKERFHSDYDQKNIQELKDSLGKSFSKNQIPYRMEMDLDRLCLETSLNAFLEDADTQRAYLVYYCYLEMFLDPANSSPRKMIERLSEYELKTSALTKRHRDHFVHSVYVFAMGLAIYQASKLFKKAYADRFGFQAGQERAAAHHFLRYWGFTALFHDIGYPFELAFSQIADYSPDEDPLSFRVCYRPVQKKGRTVQRNGYRPLCDALLEGGKVTLPDRCTVNDLFAAALAERLYDSFKDIRAYQLYLEEKKLSDSRQQFYHYFQLILNQKTINPDFFKGFMDHAYFSAYLMLHQLWRPEQTCFPHRDYLDALTAILLHNSLYKHTLMEKAEAAEDYRKLTAELHPLAYLLMLCDELQCWDRFAYGTETRTAAHPFDCYVTISDEKINVEYRFDEALRDKNSGTYKELCGVGHPNSLEKEILRILRVNTRGALKFSATGAFKPRPAASKEPLSDRSFLDLYNMAVLLHAEYMIRPEYERDVKVNAADITSEKQREAWFNELSLEYKLANILRVQRFAQHLDRLDLFFTDRLVAYRELETFSDKQLEDMGSWEHTAWKDNKKLMGWVNGSSYEIEGISDDEKNCRRERTREHKYISTPFKALEADKKKKDTEPMKQMKKYMLENYGIRIDEQASAPELPEKRA